MTSSFQRSYVPSHSDQESNDRIATTGHVIIAEGTSKQWYSIFMQMLHIHSSQLWKPRIIQTQQNQPIYIWYLSYETNDNTINALLYYYFAKYSGILFLHRRNLEAFSSFTKWDVSIKLMSGCVEVYNPSVKYHVSIICILPTVWYGKGSKHLIRLRHGHIYD